MCLILWKQTRQKHIEGHGAQSPFEIHFVSLLEMNEVKYLLQYDKYPNYSKLIWGQLHMSEIRVRQIAPVTWPAKNGELAKEMNWRKTKIVVVFTIVAIVHDRI